MSEFYEWRRAFLAEGLKVGIPAGATFDEIEAWANSMAWIADQFDDDDGAELVEA